MNVRNEVNYDWRENLIDIYNKTPVEMTTAFLTRRKEMNDWNVVGKIFKDIEVCNKVIIRTTLRLIIICSKWQVVQALDVFWQVDIGP